MLTADWLQIVFEAGGLIIEKQFTFAFYPRTCPKIGAGFISFGNQTTKKALLRKAFGFK
ncbi:hypothetical protein AB4Z29_24875 [Paenibacillus sp. 2TAB23]|uniref:hypothetical protein n=1 Tax=Paenibacillus sp. 2TAB23 TaxID=3233004 RepID=UPI003F9ACF69